jgi:hypothetical protein
MVTADRAQIIVSPDANTRPSVERVTEQDMYSEVALIRSDALVREVLEPHWDPSWQDHASIGSRIWSALMFPIRLPSILYRRLHGIPQLTGLDMWVNATLANLDVGVVDNSKLIAVHFYSARPEWAAEFLNKLIAKHIERRARLSQQSEARRFYETQRDVLAEKAHTAEEALSAFNRQKRCAIG